MIDTFENFHTRSRFRLKRNWDGHDYAHASYANSKKEKSEMIIARVTARAARCVWTTRGRASTTTHPPCAGTGAGAHTLASTLAQLWWLLLEAAVFRKSNGDRRAAAHPSVHSPACYGFG